MRPTDIDWGANISFVISMLGECKTGAEAAEKLAAYFGKPVTKKTLHKAMLLHTGFGYGQFLDKNTDTGCSPGPTVPKSVTIDPGSGIGNVPHREEHLAVVRAVQKGADTLEVLCDRLGQPPSRVRSLVAEAQAAGYTLHLADDTIRFGLSEPPRRPAHIDLGKAGDGSPVMALGDTHYGARGQEREALAAYIADGYHRLGVRVVLHTGDVFEGKLRHPGHEYELERVGWEAQARLACEHLPQLEGLKYYFIDGNHDMKSFWAPCGMEPGKALVNKARAEYGRDDLVHLGSFEGRVLIGEEGDPDAVKVQLWHPGGGRPYALSYRGQNAVRDMPPAWHPDVLLIGHLHHQGNFRMQDVKVIHTGCWTTRAFYLMQKGGHPEIGGTVFWARKSGRHFWLTYEEYTLTPRAPTWVPVAA